MSTVDFAIDINLDGVSYPAARDQSGARQSSTTYEPKVRSARLNSVGDATLDPIEYTSWHAGAGASRNIAQVKLAQFMVAYGENAWTGDPGLLLPGPEVTAITLTGAPVSQPPRPDGISEADGHIFVAAGQYVWKLASGQAASPLPSQDLDLTVGHQALGLRRFGSSLFLSQSGGTGALYERPDGGAWTATLLGSTTVAPTGALGRVWWTTGGVTTERLVAQFGTRGIRYCSSSPRLDTSWTPGLSAAAIDIGGTGAITRFGTTLTHLYIGATSGLMDLDSSGLAPNLVPAAELEVLSTGGLATLCADGFVYYSAGYRLWRISATGQSYATPEDCTPMVRLPNETPVAGYGTAILKRGEWIIYAQYDPVLDTTWVSWGRDAVGDWLHQIVELGPVVWNVAPIVLHGWKVTALHVSGLATDGPRLWMFGVNQAGTVQAWWAPLAYTTPYGDLKAGRARRFAQTCFVVMPAEDGGDDAIQKDVEEILNENENLGAGNSILVSARKETESTFTQMATFTSGPRAISQIGQAFLTSRPTFRIELTGTPASPPVCRRVSVRWLPNPDRREVRKYLLQVGRAEQYGSGQWSGYGAEESIDNVTRLANQASRTTLVDEFGNALNVRVLKVDGPNEVTAVQSNEQTMALAVTVSIFGALPGAPFGWDAGVGYDSNHSWT